MPDLGYNVETVFFPIEIDLTNNLQLQYFNF